VTPSALNVSAGSRVPVTVHVVRKDGFDGDIALSLLDAPPGYALAGTRVPAGRDRIRVTLKVPRRPPDRPLPLQILGRARIGGRKVIRRAVPAEDMMQAFGLRHLVAVEQLLVDVRKSRGRGVAVTIEGEGPKRLPIGGTTRVRVSAPGFPANAAVEFALGEPPPGVTLEDVLVEAGALTLLLRADAENARVGLEDNLIVEVYAVGGGKRRGAKDKGKAKAPQRRWRYYLGVLPAIPVVLVPR
jgi:hypothetical protein